VAAVQYTFTQKQYIEPYKITIHRTQQFWKSAGRAPSWLVIPWHLPYNRGKSRPSTSVTVPHDCERSNTSKVPFCPMLHDFRNRNVFERSLALPDCPCKDGMILTEENDCARRKICSTATLSTINFTRTVLASNTDLKTDINLNYEYPFGTAQ